MLLEPCFGEQDKVGVSHPSLSMCSASLTSQSTIECRVQRITGFTLEYNAIDVARKMLLIGSSVSMLKTSMQFLRVKSPYMSWTQVVHYSQPVILILVIVCMFFKDYVLRPCCSSHVEWILEFVFPTCWVLVSYHNTSPSIESNKFLFAILCAIFLALSTSIITSDVRIS